MLPPELLRQVRRLQLQARRAVQSLLGGAYHSAFKGTGLSFEEVRSYEPGDDVRWIDWNVTARMGQPYIKRFTEERELTVILVVDVSGSLRFGTQKQAKQSVLAEVAALLAFSAISNNDRVGFISCSDRIEKHIPPAKGTRHVLRLLREILDPNPQGKATDLNAALDHLNKTQKRRAIVFFLSDFLADDFADRFRLAAHQHDLVAVRVTDPREVTWPAVGLVDLEDAETGQQLLVDTNDDQFRQQFEKRRRDQREQFAKLVRGCGTDLIDVTTNGLHFDALVKFFRQREQRRRSR